MCIIYIPYTYVYHYYYYINIVLQFCRYCLPYLFSVELHFFVSDNLLFIIIYFFAHFLDISIFGWHLFVSFAPKYGHGQFVFGTDHCHWNTKRIAVIRGHGPYNVRVCPRFCSHNSRTFNTAAWKTSSSLHVARLTKSLEVSIVVVLGQLHRKRLQMVAVAQSESYFFYHKIRWPLAFNCCSWILTLLTRRSF